MADEDQTGLTLADVLRGLQAEVARVGRDGDGLRPESVTVDLDVSLEPRGDGGVAFRVGRNQGGGKRPRTRVSVTLRTDATPGDEVVPVPESGRTAHGTAGAGDQDAVAGEVSSPESRPPGLVDVLAEALKSIADSASRSAGSGWPYGPGSGGDSGVRGTGA